VASGEPESAECGRGPADFKICLDDPRRRCTVDADCPNRNQGVCIAAPRCFASPPQPFYTSILDVCLVTPLEQDSTGSVDPETGHLTIRRNTRTLVYGLIRGPSQPCPLCVAGVCNRGARQGLPCRPSASPDGTSLDCPPQSNSYILSVGPALSDLSTAPVAMTAPDGLFCPGQRNPGAFGDAAARRIELNRGAAGDLRDGIPHAAALVNLSCLPATGNPPVDDASDFPGPQGMSIAGSVQFTK
jgi:hypothetical protein